MRLRFPVRDSKGADGIKYSARRLAARILFASGASGAYRRMALRNRAVVLMYHRVLPGEEGNPAAFEGIRVDPLTLDRQMAYLREHFAVLALDDLRRHLRDRIPFPPNSCMVTFDDGWKDNYRHAYPVLKRYEIPAVVFLTVGHIGTRKRFWQERTFAALYGIREAAERTSGNPPPHGNFPEGIKFEDLAALPEKKFREEVRERIRSMKKLPLNRIEPIVDAIEACVGLPRGPASEGDSFLSWEEIDEMSRGGIDFGSHGMNHEILTNVTADEVRKEVLESRRIIEERIRKRVYAFSYPNGDHDPAVRRCIGECGYEIAFGTRRGFATPDDDPLSLNRVNVHDDVTREVPMFLSSILGMI
ncbi:MAG: hypothetical protein C4529_08855 [Deltaproteobacteria bacterium]|nr:MAG: hypothetical protein C4529_08855 [Deltaproteobacteria bacterium]